MTPLGRLLAQLEVLQPNCRRTWLAGHVWRPRALSRQDDLHGIRDDVAVGAGVGKFDPGRSGG